MPYRLLLPLIAVLLALVAPTAAAAAAPPLCDPGDGDIPIPSLTIGDVDGDNVGDRVIGFGDRDEIVVRGSRGRIQTLAGTPGGGLGSAVAVGDVDGDACSDVVAGAPQLGGHGAVLIYRGSPDGVATTPTVIPGSAPDGRFGGAVGLADRARSSAVDLWVGAPGADAVHRYVLDAGTVTLAGTVTGDGFGEVLAPLRNGALLGVPHADVKGHDAAGMVVRLGLDPDGTPVVTQHLTLPRPRPGDRFGAALATTISGSGGIAGAPGRDLPGAHDAGVAALVTGRRLGERIAQGVRGTPGRFERGDRFGAAVTSGRAFLCGEATSYAIGAPGEDLGGRRDAGSGTIVEDDYGCDPRALWRGHGLIGRPHRHERIGGALGIVRERDDWEEDAAEDLLALAPSAALVLTRPGGAGPGRPASFSIPPGVVAFAVPAVGNTLD